MLSFGIARRAVALPCLSTRTRSDRHFPDLAGACARGGRGRYPKLLPFAKSARVSPLVPTSTVPCFPPPPPIQAEALGVSRLYWLCAFKKNPVPKAVAYSSRF